MCELLRKLTKLTSAKVEMMWNATYQKMFEEAMVIMKEDACMKFYNKTTIIHSLGLVWEQPYYKPETT